MVCAALHRSLTAVAALVVRALAVAAAQTASTATAAPARLGNASSRFASARQQRRLDRPEKLRRRFL